MASPPQYLTKLVTVARRHAPWAHWHGVLLHYDASRFSFASKPFARLAVDGHEADAQVAHDVIDACIARAAGRNPQTHNDEGEAVRDIGMADGLALGAGGGRW